MSRRTSTGSPTCSEPTFFGHTVGAWVRSVWLVLIRTVEAHVLRLPIVPAIKKMDLLSDRQRTRFQVLGILQFENWEDPLAAISPTGATSARLA